MWKLAGALSTLNARVNIVAVEQPPARTGGALIRGPTAAPRRQKDEGARPIPLVGRYTARRPGIRSRKDGGVSLARKTRLHSRGFTREIRPNVNVFSRACRNRGRRNTSPRFTIVPGADANQGLFRAEITPRCLPAVGIRVTEILRFDGPPLSSRTGLRPTGCYDPQTRFLGIGMNLFTSKS